MTPNLLRDRISSSMMGLHYKIMIPLCVPNLTEIDQEKVRECVASKFVSSAGHLVDEFSAKVAKRSGFKYGNVVASGTSALHLSLLACGVRPMSRVITSTYTFIGTANAIHAAQAEPIFIDIDRDTHCLNLDLLETFLIEETYINEGKCYLCADDKPIDAVMPVLVNGNLLDFKRLKQIKTQYNLSVVVDGAAAFGHDFQEVPFAKQAIDVLAFSFNGNKIITTGGGGAVVTDDESFFNFVHSYSSTARAGNGYDHFMKAANLRMPNLNASLGLAQLERLEQFLWKKKEIFKGYVDALGSLDWLRPLYEDIPSTNWLSTVILQGDDVMSKKFSDHMSSAEIESRSFWKPMHLQEPYMDCSFISNGQSDAMWSRIHVLPCSTNLTADEQRHVIETIKEFER